MAKHKPAADLFDKSNDDLQGPVECLGMTFADDNARREHFLGILREKLKDPEFRKIEGFPIGSDEDILALSDPPYYTACPNPFLADFIKVYGKPYDPGTPYSREPFATDVSEGKNDPIYNAHSYHTKVPHKAIMRYILHYTDPEDVVLDGFCGTGMAGVAAQLCGDKTAIESIGLNVGENRQILDSTGTVISRLGSRKAVLNDLSPAATFIAANYTTPVDLHSFEREARRILNEIADEYGWMYETQHLDGKTKGRISYTVWSEVFTCPQCSGEITFLDEALEKGRVKDSFPCPHCNAAVGKSSLEKIRMTVFDPVFMRPRQTLKRIPVRIEYKVAEKKFNKRLDEFDKALNERIDAMPLPSGLPSVEFPYMHMTHERVKLADYGVTHIHHLFFPRTTHILAKLWQRALDVTDPRVRAFLLFTFEQAILGMSLQNRYGPTHFSQVNRTLSGVYYISSLMSEVSPWYILDGKLNRLVKAFSSLRRQSSDVSIATMSAAAIPLPDSSVDYVFTDPPFGENIYYSDLNFIVESWHKVVTNSREEAIVDKAKKKALPEYQSMMRRAFANYYRVLKPGRWMTVEFHNSHNAVWTAIQEALLSAGFVVADVRTLDKQQSSYRQVTAASAAKQDLVISAYRPNGGLEDRFKLAAGTNEGAWDFVRTHLTKLPVFASQDGKAEPIAERHDYLLFDRMVAFHVQRGVTVPLSAAEFYAGLTQRFSERDGMYFLPEQVAEYDKRRLTVKEVLQLSLFVSDEASAIQWLKQQLTKRPQTFQELHPQFLREIGGWSKSEQPLELSTLLEQNFLRYDGNGTVPSQIHSYLSTNFKELRNLPKDSPELRTKGKDRWYVPDPNKAGDLEKLRERALLKEFAEYLPPGHKLAKPESQEGFLPGMEPKPTPIPRGKKMKVIRLEAVRAGFKYCWQNRDYRTIIAVAQRIPENVLQEDPKLLMWYDQAITRTGEE
jgi:DNA modification methylase